MNKEIKIQRPLSYLVKVWVSASSHLPHDNLMGKGRVSTALLRCRWVLSFADFITPDFRQNSTPEKRVRFLFLLIRIVIPRPGRLTSLGTSCLPGLWAAAGITGPHSKSRELTGLWVGLNCEPYLLHAAHATCPLANMKERSFQNVCEVILLRFLASSVHQALESLQPIGITSPGTKEGIREEKL